MWAQTAAGGVRVRVTTKKEGGRSYTKKGDTPRVLKKREVPGYLKKEGPSHLKRRVGASY